MKKSDLNQLQRDTLLVPRVREITDLYNNLLQNVNTIKGLADENKRQLSRILNLPKGEKGDQGEIGPRGIQGKPGRDGVDGKDGYTPVKGKDYYTQSEEEGLLLKTLARIRQPKDGETPMVDEDKIAELAANLIREKKLLGVNDVKGVREELSSYRNQMALKQAGQHGGGDTIVAGTNIQLTRNANGTTTIAAVGAGTGSVTDFIFTDANGITGVVTTSTTTPTLTLDISGLDASNSSTVRYVVSFTSYAWSTNLSALLVPVRRVPPVAPVRKVTSCRSVMLAAIRMSVPSKVSLASPSIVVALVQMAS